MLSAMTPSTFVLFGTYEWISRFTTLTPREFRGWPDIGWLVIQSSFLQCYSPGSLTSPKAARPLQLCCKVQRVCAWSKYWRIQSDVQSERLCKSGTMLCQHTDFLLYICSCADVQSYLQLLLHSHDYLWRISVIKMTAFLQRDLFIYWFTILLHNR